MTTLYLCSGRLRLKNKKISCWLKIVISFHHKQGWTCSKVSLNTADYVTTNMAGDVPSSHQKYPMASHLEMLKLSYELWSLAYQLLIWKLSHKHEVLTWYERFCWNVSMVLSLWQGKLWKYEWFKGITIVTFGLGDWAGCKTQAFFNIFTNEWSSSGHSVYRWWETESLK